MRSPPTPQTAVGSDGGGRGILLYIICNGLSGPSPSSSSPWSLWPSADDRRNATRCARG